MQLGAVGVRVGRVVHDRAGRRRRLLPAHRPQHLVARGGAQQLRHPVAQPEGGHCGVARRLEQVGGARRVLRLEEGIEREAERGHREHQAVHHAARVGRELHAPPRRGAATHVGRAALFEQRGDGGCVERRARVHELLRALRPERHQREQQHLWRDRRSAQRRALGGKLVGERAPRGREQQQRPRRVQGAEERRVPRSKLPVRRGRLQRLQRTRAAAVAVGRSGMSGLVRLPRPGRTALFLRLGSVEAGRQHLGAAEQGGHHLRLEARVGHRAAAHEPLHDGVLALPDGL